LASGKQVAIIGAGPGGLVAARYLVQHGFGPVLFEQSDRLGGQWNQGGPQSGVWPTMATNTSRVNTHFSDLDWPAGTVMFPNNSQVLAYLLRYADSFDISRQIRTRHRVVSVERASGGYRVSWRDDRGQPGTEVFPYVIVATGRYNLPKIPPVPGLESFSGRHGAIHTFNFRDAQRYRDQCVVVAGCGISAVEIAPEVALAGARRVISAMRRQRYVLQRIVAGVPIDLLWFNRYSVLASEQMPASVASNSFKQFILRTSGSPEQWGAMKADGDPSVAGVTQAQFYLPLIAEGRIVAKPWVQKIDGRRITFEDGGVEEADALLFATGFRLNLPFLSDDIRALIGESGPSLRLYRHTFHPDLPGMAFLGLVHQGGPLFPPLELQARWITYTWAGLSPQAGDPQMSEEIAGEIPSELPLSMHKQCLLFARAAGVEPDLTRWPELRRALLFGPLSGISFRLSGPDALADAPQRFAKEAAEFGLIASPGFSADEMHRLNLLKQSASVHEG
jgi:dimethylaniline monooxygenase (N-oxide forming)